MMLRDVQMVCSADVADSRIINFRTRVVCEAVIFALHETRVDSPGRKLQINLVDSGAWLPPRTAYAAESVIETWVEIDPLEFLLESASAFSAIRKALLTALDLVESGIGWGSRSLSELIENIYLPDLVFKTDLERFSRWDRVGKRSISLEFEMTEYASQVSIVVADRSGANTFRQIVAKSTDGPEEFPYLFSGRSAAIVRGSYIIKDKNDTTIAELPLNEIE